MIRKRIASALSALSLVAVSGGTAFAWWVQGSVVCPNNTPFSGVAIDVTGNACQIPFSATATTDGSGSFFLELLNCDGCYTATIDATTLPPDAAVSPSMSVNFCLTGNQYSKVINWTVNSSVCQVITSTPSVINPALQIDSLAVVLAHEPAVFTVGTFEVNRLPLGYLWDFGDGGTSTDSEPTHVFTNCGQQAVSVTISDGIASTNASLNLVVPCLLNLAKLHAKLNFSKANVDSCVVKGTLDLPSNYSFAGKSATLDIGGAKVSFTLNKKGVGVTGVNKFNKPIYKKQTGLWGFKATLKKGSWQTAWANCSMANSNIPKPGVLVTNFPVIMVLDNEAFMGTANLHYSAKQGKSGTAN